MILSLQELEAHYGMRPIIYTDTYIYDEYISGRYDDYDIWISAHDIPESLNDGREWTFLSVYLLRKIRKCSRR